MLGYYVLSSSLNKITLNPLIDMSMQTFSGVSNISYNEILDLESVDKNIVHPYRSNIDVRFTAVMASLLPSQDWCSSNTSKNCTKDVHLICVELESLHFTLQQVLVYYVSIW